MSVRAKPLNDNSDNATASLHAVIKGKDKGDRQWKEVADLLTFSPTGSSFYLPRQREVGTLLSLMITLPVHMRCYDFQKESYRVWGLVQHCESVMTENDEQSFHIGVAFIGKHCPESYRKNPLQHYRISGVDELGMWKVEETKTPFKKREDLRFWTQLELYLALIDTKEGSTGGERTTSENVSRSGASVFTTMNVNIGDRVKFISAEYDFSGLAVVCNTQTADDGRKKLHLKFIQNTFPVQILTRKNLEFQKI